MKHVIEPTLILDFTSPISDFRRTPILSDISDFVVGSSSRATYGFTNRFFYRGRSTNGARGSTREFVTVGIQQTSYFASGSEPLRHDLYQRRGTGTGRELSPVTMTARVSPSSWVDANSRVEYDVSGNGLQVFTTGATLNRPEGGLTVNYSRQRLDKTLPPSSFVSASARAQWPQKRVSTTYTVSFDVARSKLVSQGIIGSYMAQCCGVQAEYQQFSFPSGYGLPFSADRRLNLSFVLAGLATFSNFLGSFGGLQ